MKLSQRLTATFALHLLLVAGASAAQFVMFDQEVAWPVPKGSTNRHGGGARFWHSYPSAGTPTNWLAPVNYRDGRAYLRFETTVKDDPATCAGVFTFWPTADCLGN